jgi:hypothetical protein
MTGSCVNTRLGGVEESGEDGYGGLLGLDRSEAASAKSIIVRSSIATDGLNFVQAYDQFVANPRVLQYAIAIADLFDRIDFTPSKDPASEARGVINANELHPDVPVSVGSHDDASWVFVVGFSR